jgi:general secretion pathway protein G
MKLQSFRRLGRAGFTLAEMMVVIVILGLLATLVVPNVIAKLNTAFKGKAVSDITAITNALNEFAMNNAMKYPDTLEALVTPDTNGNTYLNMKKVPLDPWKNEYQYEPPRAGQPQPRVFTNGKDGQPGGEGDDADIDNFMIADGETSGGGRK